MPVSLTLLRAVCSCIKRCRTASNSTAGQTSSRFSLSRARVCCNGKRAAVGLSCSRQCEHPKCRLPLSGRTGSRTTARSDRSLPVLLFARQMASAGMKAVCGSCLVSQNAHCHGGSRGNGRLRHSSMRMGRPARISMWSPRMNCPHCTQSGAR